MKATKYFVYLDGDDRYDWFDDELDAIEYAQKNGNKNTRIEKVEGELSDDGFDFDYEETDKTPVEFSMELPKEEPVEFVDNDEEFIMDFPDIPEVESSDDSEYDAMAKQYADDQLVDPYDADEFDGHEDFDVKEALDKLEENESEVECKNCFDLFPKEECVKTDHGYLCKKCNQELHSHQGTNLDLIDANPKDLDYDDPRLPEEKEEPEVKEEPLDANEVRKHEAGITEAVDPQIDEIIKSWRTNEALTEDADQKLKLYAIFNDGDEVGELVAANEEDAVDRCYNGAFGISNSDDMFDAELVEDPERIAEYEKTWKVKLYNLEEIAEREADWEDEDTFDTLDKLNADTKKTYSYTCSPSGLGGAVDATSEKEARRKVEEILAAAGVYVPDERIKFNELEEDLKVITDFSDYKPWSGAVDTYDLIEDAGKLDDFEAYLEELYPDGLTVTQINDILWFDGEQVLNDLGIGDHDEADDEVEYNSEDDTEELPDTTKTESLKEGTDLGNVKVGDTIEILDHSTGKYVKATVTDKSKRLIMYKREDGKEGYVLDADKVKLKKNLGLGENLEEHINDRPADIESDQKLQGIDNAVVDCKKYTVVAHSEDEKPVDCKLEKPALEEPLAGEKVDAKLYEGAANLKQAIIDRYNKAVSIHYDELKDQEDEETADEWRDNWYSIVDVPDITAEDYVVVFNKPINDDDRELVAEYLIDDSFYDLHPGENKVDYTTGGDENITVLRSALNENLQEAKKDEEELPPDPEVVKLEVHQELNNLVADEIEAIDGYEEVKADIIDKPIEHKDEIIDTINHIEDEEKEHIDELVGVTTEIPFDGEHKEEAPAPVVEEPAIEEEPAPVVEEPAVEEGLEENCAADTPFDSEVKVGDSILIINMEGEPDYCGRKGKVEHIDGIGQLHGTWGGCAVIPGVDKFDIITDECLKEDINKVGYITMVIGDGGDDIYYVGYDKDAAIKAVDDQYPDWINFGLGGGDTAPGVIECNLSDDKNQAAFDTLLKRYNNKEKLYDGDLKAFGYSSYRELLNNFYDNLKVIYSGDEEAPEDEWPTWDDEDPFAITDSDIEYLNTEAPGLDDENDGRALHELNLKDALTAAQHWYEVNNGDVFWSKVAKALEAKLKQANENDLIDSFALSNDKIIVNTKQANESLKEDAELEEEKEVFTPEEQEEWNCDEDGESLDGFDTYHHCGWCGDVDTEYDMKHELNFGWLCPQCVAALKSRGEKLTITEASSAETRAFKNGGKDLDDLIQGKAIARIKDPKARAAAVAAAKAGRPDAVKDFTGDRKEDQAAAAYEKKAQAMADAGVKENLNESATVKYAIGYCFWDYGWYIALVEKNSKGKECITNHRDQHFSNKYDGITFDSVEECIAEIKGNVEKYAPWTYPENIDYASGRKNGSLFAVGLNEAQDGFVSEDMIFDCKAHKLIPHKE